MEVLLNEGRRNEKGQNKVYVVILHLSSKNLWTKPRFSLQANLWFSPAFFFFSWLNDVKKRAERRSWWEERERIHLVYFSFKVTPPQTNSFNVIPSKGSLEKVIGEMAKVDRELTEVKEELGTTIAPVGKNKDEGQLNYIIEVILLNRKFSLSQLVLRVTDRSSHLKEIQFRNRNSFWNSLCGVLSFRSIH